MKQFRTILAVFLAVLMLAACGGSGNSGNSGNADKPAQTTPVQTQPPVETTPATTAEPTTAPTEAPIIALDPVVENPLVDDHYEITELCTITDAQFNSFSGYCPITYEINDGEYTDYLYSFTGDLLIQEGCSDYDYFTNGVTAMYGDGYGVQLVNIFNGTHYLVDDGIQNIYQLSDRFYYVVYSDYSLVYDVEKTAFIDGLMIMGDGISDIPVVIGTTVFEETDYETYRAWLDNGTVIDSIDCASLTPNGFIREEGDHVLVYDEECHLITTVKNAIPMMDYTNNAEYSGKFFRTGEFRSYTVVDMNGNVIIPGPLNGVEASGDYIIARNDQDQYALYLGDGSMIADFEYTIITYKEELEVFQLSHISGMKYFYIPGVGMVDITDTSGYEIIARDDQYLIYATGEYVDLPNGKDQIHAIMTECDMGLIDLISGSILVNSGFDFVHATQDHLYVRYGDNWTVYRLELIR